MPTITVFKSSQISTIFISKIRFPVNLKIANPKVLMKYIILQLNHGLNYYECIFNTKRVY